MWLVTSDRFGKRGKPAVGSLGGRGMGLRDSRESFRDQLDHHQVGLDERGDEVAVLLPESAELGYAEVFLVKTPTRELRLA
jgi:hypothetical protein